MIAALALAVMPVIAAAISGGAPAEAAPRLVIHYPPDDLVVSGAGLLRVIAEVSDPGPHTLEIRLDGVPTATPVAMHRPGGGAVMHAPVQLAPGLATLEVTLREAGRPAESITRRIFLLSVVAKAGTPPPRFRWNPFHQDAREKACAGCHEMTSQPGDAGPPAPDQSTCFPCHARVTAVKEVHGPAALWACTRCHDARRTPGRYATPDPVLPLCFSCHAEQKERFYGSRYQHGPTATGLCTICHSPHGTEEQFFLKKTAWELCTTCHAEKASGRHVISWGPQGQGHPTRGRPDPNRPDRELSCASCHNPHAAPGPKLWNFQATDWLELCRNCHARLMGG